jgi:hypothetical protein
MRRVGRIELDPLPLPKFEDHAAWCRWLWNRGSLAQPHRRCMESEHCVATAHVRSDTSWRSA